MKRYEVVVGKCGVVEKTIFDSLLDAHHLAASYILLFLAEPSRNFDPMDAEHIRWISALGFLVPSDIPDKKTAMFAEALKEYMHVCDDAGAPQIRIIAKKTVDTPGT